MFNVTHISKPGVCKARRCKFVVVSDGLCEKHLAEWNAAGCPPFANTGSAIVSTNLLSHGTQEGLAEERVNAEKSLSLIETFEITSQETMDMAGQFLSGVREAGEGLTRRMEEQLAPLKASEESILAVFGPLKQIYAACEGSLRAKINSHIRRQQELQDAARMEVEAAGGSVDSNTLTIAHGIENVALPVGMGVRETWSYEVTDEAALRRAASVGELRKRIVELGREEELEGFLQAVQELMGVETHVSPAMLAVNHKHLAAVARSLKSDAQIPGVRVFSETTATAPRRNGNATA